MPPSSRPKASAHASTRSNCCRGYMHCWPQSALGARASWRWMKSSSDTAFVFVPNFFEVHPMHHQRIRLDSLHEKIMSAAQAAAFIQDRMTVGMSGFGGAGDAKAVPLALIERAREHPLNINLITGASLGRGLDGQMAEAGLLARRMPFQGDPVLRKAINEGRVV